MAAVIKYPEHGGFRQHKFILSQFWRLRVQKQSTGPKAVSQQGCAILRGSREEAVACLFQLPVATWGCITNTCHWVTPPPSLLSLCQISPRLSLRKTLVIWFRVHPPTDPPRWSPLPKILNSITSAKTLFPHKLTFASSRDSNSMYLCGHYSAYCWEPPIYKITAP